MWGRSVVTGLLLLLVMCANRPVQAQESSPACDESRQESWSHSAIEPAKDITSLLEKQGWTTLGGEHVMPKVVSIKDIRHFVVPEANPELSTCKAIVETDHGNYLVFFWYTESSAGTRLHLQILEPLFDHLPADITLEGLGPYGPGADASVNTYARVVVDMPFCKLRSKRWADTLRAKVLAAIPVDRQDLAAEFNDTMKDEASDPDPDSCKGPDSRDALRYGDGVVAGTRSVWAIFD